MFASSSPIGQKQRVSVVSDDSSIHLDSNRFRVQQDGQQQQQQQSTSFLSAFMRY